MGFAVRACNIHCINCHYEGRSRVQGPGRGAAILLIVSVAGGILYWPLFSVATAFLLWVVCTPTCHICPRCGWKYPIPVEVHEKQKRLAHLCSCRTDALSPGHHAQLPPRKDHRSSAVVRSS